VTTIYFSVSVIRVHGSKQKKKLVGFKYLIRDTEMGCNGNKKVNKKQNTSDK
jgi:hypothetical protein